VPAKTLTSKRLLHAGATRRETEPPPATWLTPNTSSTFSTEPPTPNASSRNQKPGEPREPREGLQRGDFTQVARGGRGGSSRPGARAPQNALTREDSSANATRREHGDQGDQEQRKAKVLCEVGDFERVELREVRRAWEKTPCVNAKISTNTPTVTSNTDSTKNAAATVGVARSGDRRAA